MQEMAREGVTLVHHATTYPQFCGCTCAQQVCDGWGGSKGQTHTFEKDPIPLLTAYMLDTCCYRLRC